MARFGQFNFGEDVFGDGTPDSTGGPLPDEYGRVAWNFFDGVNSYDLPINPDSATMPSIKRQTTTKATASGRQVMYQGKPLVPEFFFSGVILSENEYRAFEEWVDKRKQIRITDDLGMKYWVYFKSFSPTRVKDSRYPWHHTYSAAGVLLDRG